MVKRNWLLNIVRGGMLALSLLLGLAIAAPAQSNVGSGTSTGSTTNRTDTRDNGMDWGWIGLLGLAGLLGLLPKKRTADADYRGTDTSTRSATAR